MALNNLYKKYFLVGTVSALVLCVSFAQLAEAQVVGLSVITYPASSTQDNGAVLNGYAEVSTESDSKNIIVWFQWGPDTGMTFATPKNGIYVQGAFSRYIGGLKKNTTYYYRAVAQVGDQLVFGSQQSFTTRTGITETSSSPALVSTFTASNVSSTFATLNGQVDPRDSENTQRWFEWGETTSFGKTTPRQAAGSTVSSFSYVITGLRADTTYYYRAVAQGTGGLVQGNTFAFRTPGVGATTGTGGTGVGVGTGTSVIPAVDTLPAYGVTGTQAILNGIASSNATVSAMVWFEWGVGGSLKETTGKTSLVSPTSQSYTQVLGGLSPNTTYSFRAAIQTVYGTSYGATRTFTTLKNGAAVTPSTGSTGGGSGTTGGDKDEDTTGGISTTTGGENGISFAKKAAWWLLVVLLVLLIVSVIYHLTESLRKHKEEKKKAKEAQEIKKEAEIARGKGGHEEETIRFKLPGQ